MCYKSNLRENMKALRNKKNDGAFPMQGREPGNSFAWVS